MKKFVVITQQQLTSTIIVKWQIKLGFCSITITIRNNLIISRKVEISLWAPKWLKSIIVCFLKSADFEALHFLEPPAKWNAPGQEMSQKCGTVQWK